MLKKLSLAALATCVCLWAADPMVGTWKVNKSKSMAGPGHGPQSHTIKVEETGDELRVVIETINNEGKPTTSSYTVRKDGKDYPVTASPTDTTNWTRVDEHTTDMIRKKDGREISRTHVVVAPDGQTQTVTGSGIDPKGQKFKYSSIYEKQ